MNLYWLVKVKPIQTDFWVLNSMLCVQMLPPQQNTNHAPLPLIWKPPSFIFQLIKSILTILTLRPRFRPSLLPEMWISFLKSTKDSTISLSTLTQTPWEVMTLRNCGSLKMAQIWPVMKFLCKLYSGLLSYLFLLSLSMSSAMDAAVENVLAAILLRVFSQWEMDKSHE